jgi:DNA gyrase subunit A
VASNLPPRAYEIVPIEEEMKRSYLDYAMSVIVSRALPDARDGLKPVQRRILFAMRESGFDFGKPHRKSARIVGEVMGKYHPHGDSAIYDAMVRLAQDFAMRLPLIDGQGNFGSMDGDAPAAMRYTEARLARSADALLADIDKDTVDFRPNYDESGQEPSVLPAQFPHLLVNGAGGIAVGMATNIPPHNLGEIIDATIALIDEPELGLDELAEIVKGPDFPTGGIILGRNGILNAYTTGRGGLILRGQCAVEEVRRDRLAIIVSEVPYQVNKAKMVERIAEVVREKKVEGVSDLRDESDRHGVRVVIEVKREADPEVVLNQLYKFTPLQTSFGVNMVALRGGRPELLTLKELLESFVAFREEVILRRTAFDLAKARERAHIALGLVVAVANIDEVIALIRRAPDPAAARAELMARGWPVADVMPLVRAAQGGEEAQADAQIGPDGYRLSDAQARAILALQLSRLTGLERDKLAAELEEIGRRIAELLLILRSRERLLEVMREELLRIREQFATPRRTVIDLESEPDVDIEELIQREDMVVTVTHKGWIKRVPLSTFRAQRRGGKGRAGMRTHEDDFVGRLFVANTHTPVLFFSSLGRVYKLKVYKLPLGNPQARGRAMINLFPSLAEGESITPCCRCRGRAPLGGDEPLLRHRERPGPPQRAGRLPARAGRRQDRDGAGGGRPARRRPGLPRRARRDPGVGRRARDPLPGGQRAGVQVAQLRGRERDGPRLRRRGDLDVDRGPPGRHDRRARRVPAREQRAPPPGRGRERGRRGGSTELRLLSPERFAELAASEQLLLTVTVNGFGKRTSALEYRVTGRGGQGIINIETSARNGRVAATFPVGEHDQIMLVTDAGQTIRMPVQGIRVTGRNTQGVKLFHTADGEHVVSAAHLEGEEGANGVETEEEAVPAADLG